MSAQLLGNCPRCRAKRTTFDVLSSVLKRVEHGWLYTFEAACSCRECARLTIFIIRQNSDTTGLNLFKEKQRPHTMEGSISGLVKIEGFVNISDIGAAAPPEHLPNDVDTVFQEATKCHTIGCWNAAGAMFRSAIDIATRALLPQADVEGLSRAQRRNLGLRLPWLFGNGLLPRDLEDLSHCVREDGNDGVHEGSLREDEADDLADFTRLLLQRLFTEPRRLELAAARREERRAKSVPDVAQEANQDFAAAKGSNALEN